MRGVLGGVVDGVPRDDYCLIGAIGHDFYEGERDGPRGFPRFTDPSLRGPGAYGDYLRMELALAFQHDLPIFPVLLDNASMPARDELPPVPGPATWHAERRAS